MKKEGNAPSGLCGHRAPLPPSPLSHPSFKRAWATPLLSSFRQIRATATLLEVTPRRGPLRNRWVFFISERNSHK